MYQKEPPVTKPTLEYQIVICYYSNLMYRRVPILIPPLVYQTVASVITPTLVYQILIYYTNLMHPRVLTLTQTLVPDSHPCHTNICIIGSATYHKNIGTNSATSYNNIVYQIVTIPVITT